MIRPELIESLRKEAEAEAKQILKDRKKFGIKEFESKQNISKKRESSLHSLLNQEDINHCLNNGLDMMYLYNEMDAKYKGGVTEKKQYYIPRGTPRGRPKKYNNEQEQ
jgi:hypothetical protein